MANVLTLVLGAKRHAARVYDVHVVKHQALDRIRRVSQDHPRGQPRAVDFHIAQRDVAKVHAACVFTTFVGRLSSSMESRRFATVFTLCRAVRRDGVVKSALLAQVRARFVLLLRANPDSPPKWLRYRYVLVQDVLDHGFHALLTGWV